MAQRICGKNVNLDLKETIRPEGSALIIVDMQNDFCSKGGHYDKCGKRLDDIQKIIPNLSRLIHQARERGVSVIYVQNTQLSSGTYLSPSTIAHMLKRWKDESRLYYTLEGTWGHQVIDSIKPQGMDLIVKKHRPSAFTGTDLDMTLRSMGKETIMMTGVITEGCVESTAREGWLRDYYVVVAEDCIGSSSPELHDAQLRIMKETYHFVVPSEELLRTW